MNFTPGVQAPIAAVCFHDCTDFLAQIRYALFEHFAHGAYYRDFVQPANPVAATFFERYYLDDAAFRLYAAAEDLANALIFMLDLKDAQIAPYRKNNRVSVQATVAAFLKKERADWPLTQTVLRMGSSREWTFAMSYRNRWVHEQAPTVAGLGMKYRRKHPWIMSADGEKRFLAVGSGDKAEYEIADLRTPILAAFSQLHDAVRAALNEYFRILKDNGITSDGKTVTMRLRFPSADDYPSP
ncbi:MAG: hypothetical protein QOI58_2833 [Thermoanaerobaculia bacterium]|nr:hypothetical protein [Thermoanaerobaculia bacterium]